MNFVALFAGVDCFGLGLQRAGMEAAAYVEIDPHAQSVLRYHNPHKPIHGDIRHVGKHNLPAVELVVGGSPCQDFSVAGKRAGMAGQRSGLWYEYHRILQELRPRWFIFENVPGLLSSGPVDDATGERRRGIDFAIVLAGLTGAVPTIPDGGWKNAGIGNGPFYNIAWRVLDAQHFGVPQRRRRVFIVGCLAGTGCSPAEILFERESLRGGVIPRKAPGQRTAATLRAGASDTSRVGNGEEHLLLNAADYGGGDAVSYRARNFGEYEPDDTASSVKARDGKIGAVDLIAYDARNGAYSSRVTNTLQAKPNGGYSLNYQPVVFEPRYYSGRDKMGGMPSDTVGALKASNEIIGDAFPHVAAHNAVRRLTPIECERLQGLPDDWTACGIDADGNEVQISDTQRYKQIGNGGAVPVLEWIGRRIMAREAGEL